MQLNQFSGWVAQEPEYGQTNSGLSYAKFSIGVLDCFKQKDQKTQYRKCVAYGKDADNLKKSVGKGTFLIIWESRTELNEYKTAKGEDRSEIRYNVRLFENPSAFKGGSNENVIAEKSFSEAYANDELPFRN